MRYFTVNEVAELAGVTRVAVLYAVHDGRIPATRVGHIWYISEDDANAYRPRTYVRKAPPPGRRRKPEEEPAKRRVKVRRIPG